MKILPNAFTDIITDIKNFHNPRLTEIVQYPTNGKVEMALHRLQPVADVFESYAKEHGVFLTVDKATTLISDEKACKPELKKHLENCIVMKVEDGFFANSKAFLLDVTKPVYEFVERRKVFIQGKDGKLKTVEVTSRHEDGFIRAAYRTFENLTKQVKKTNSRK